MKRANVTMSIAAAKKIKVDPAVKSLDKIAKALREAEILPSAIVEMFSDTLSDFLLPLQEERHAYQKKMVETLAGELTNIEVQMQATIEQQKAAIKAAENEKVVRAGVVTKAEEALQAKRNICNEQKLALSDATKVFERANDVLSKAKGEEDSGTKEIEGAAAKNAAVQALADTLDILHTEPEKIDAAIKQIVKQLKVEEAMLVAIPSALQKGEADRQGFDKMVMEQLKQKAAARIAELSTIIGNSGPTLASLASASAVASTARGAARGNMIESAAAFTAAQGAQIDTEVTFKNAQKELRETNAKLRKTINSSHEAQAELDLFRDGALAAFDELRQRSTADIPAEQVDKMAGLEPTSPAHQAVSCAGA